MDSDSIQAIVEAIQQSVTADERTFDVTIVRDGVSVTVPYALNPNGPTILKDAIEYAREEVKRVRPDRAGRYRFSDLRSLLAWADRYKTDDTAVYLTAPLSQGANAAGSVHVIVDDLPRADLPTEEDESGAPSTSMLGASRKLTATLPLGLHKQLLEWVQLDRVWCTTEAFHTFLDDRSEQLSSAEVLGMAANIEIKSEATWKRVVDANGAVRIQSEDKAGPSAKLVKSFQFFAPVFEHDDIGNVMVFAVRVSMKIDHGKPAFRMELVDLHQKLATAMATMANEVEKHVPAVYMGTSPQ